MACIAPLAEIANGALSGKQVTASGMNHEQSKADGSLTQEQKQLPLGMARLGGGVPR